MELDDELLSHLTDEIHSVNVNAKPHKVRAEDMYEEFQRTNIASDFPQPEISRMSTLSFLQMRNRNWMLEKESRMQMKHTDT